MEETKTETDTNAVSSPGLEQRGRKEWSEELKELRESMARANEALWSGWPWRREGHQPEAVPPRSAPIAEPRGAFAPIYDWASWPPSHKRELERTVADVGRPKDERHHEFRSPTLRVSSPGPEPLQPRMPANEDAEDRKTAGRCWNCGGTHYFRECALYVGHRRFCFGCGRRDTTKRNCPKCSKDSKRGVSEYWVKSILLPKHR